MTRSWPHFIILRAASLLVPGGQRAGWIAEWKSELWYIPLSHATAFCVGAFQDALWLRRNRPVSEQPTGIHLNSPLSCLALLTALAVSGIFFAFQVIAPRLTPSSPLRVPD